MYNTRKNPIFGGRILNAKRENLNPQIDWTEDRFNRILLIQLPGFKREEIRVQLNNAGKLFIKGSRLAADNKHIDLDQSFDVPKDVISDKISGKFEDGRLTLIMPKREITGAEAITKEKTVLNEATKKEESKQEEEKRKEGKTDKERKEESEQEKDNEEGKFDKERKEESKQEKDNEEGKTDKEKKNENVIQEKTTSNEADQREKSTVTQAMASYVKDAKARLTEATHNEPTQEKENESAGTDMTQNEVNSKAEAKEMSKKPFDDHNSKDGDMENLKQKTDEGIMHEGKKKVEQTVEEIKGGYNEKAKAISNEVKNEKETTKERMQKMKSKMNEIYRDTPKEIRKKIIKMRPGEDGWLKNKYIDGAVEKINRNRNMIAVAIMAFSVGLYVSHRLKARSG